MVDTEATTAGTMAVADLDGDGYTEIVSAGYTAGEVYVYTFAP
jgi:Tfp pilus tip-associated adhesin PilY1